jgi:chromosome segregation ATPase|tara:strand:+ start:10 stop:207 length:198 start_codon:yes stop_codon:yes gene_type:complete
MALQRSVKSCLAEIHQLEIKNRMLEDQLERTKKMLELMEDSYDGLVKKWDEVVEKLRNIFNHNEE